MSARAAACAGSMAGLPVIHIEAGVRSGDLKNPWPEEEARVTIDQLASWHFCATEANAANLAADLVQRAGGYPHVHVVGNPGIDALYENVTPQTVRLRRVLVTLHRRESFGEPFKAIVSGLLEAARLLPEWEFVLFTHPNNQSWRALSAHATWSPNLLASAPADPPDFQRLLARSRAVLTDSGGVQEEAAALGIPCVIARDLTDRPESVASGHAILAGRTSEGVRDGLIKAVRNGLNSTPFLGFGRGDASQQIAEILAAHFGG